MLRASVLVMMMVGLLMTAGFTGVAPASAAPAPVVHVVLFHSTLCNHCQYVIQQVLPPLQQKYGPQLDIRMIEVSAPPDRARMRQAATALGIAPDQLGVPLLIVGQRALLGSDQIPAELPQLIEQGLAAGGVPFPNLPGLEDLSNPDAPPPAPAPLAAVEPAETPWSNGFTLAMVIMVVMVAALVYVGVAVARGDTPIHLYGTLNWLIPLVAVVGLGVAAYLTYIETQSARAICGPVGDCNAVQSSPYARLFGLIPIGLIGLVGYVAMLAAWVWYQARRDRLAHTAPLALFGMALFGVVFSIYLTYLELFVIEAVCIWCLSSAVLITLLLVLSVEPLLAANRRVTDMSVI